MEARDATGGQRHGHGAALDGQLLGRGLRPVGKVVEDMVERRRRRRAKRSRPHLAAGQPRLPVVLARRQLEHVELLLDDRDEGEEQLALKLVRRRVGGADHDDAAREQRLEQAAEDHRIGDVAHFQLVEAEQPDLFCDSLRHQIDRVLAVARCLLCLAPAMQRLVHLDHELVEMDAALVGERRVGDEQIHQHRLAAADGPVQIQSLRRVLAAPRQSQHRLPGEQAAAGLVGLQRAAQRLQLLGRQLLHRVGLQRAVAHHRPVCEEGAVSHDSDA
jgi:hypothetical protein